MPIQFTKTDVRCVIRDAAWKPFIPSLSLCIYKEKLIKTLAVIFSSVCVLAVDAIAKYHNRMA